MEAQGKGNAVRAYGNQNVTGSTLKNMDKDDDESSSDSGNPSFTLRF